MKRLLIELSIGHPRWVIVLAVLLTAAFGSQFPRIHIDTDPENMLPPHEPVRVRHDEIKETFGLSDFLVLGIEREQGAFTPEILRRVEHLTQEILGMDGVVAADVIAPGEVDDITSFLVEPDATAEAAAEPAHPRRGLRVAPLMEELPTTPDAARALVGRIHDNPILRGKLASDDGQVIALFIPLEAKSYAKSVGDRILKLIEADHGDERYHLAGLPVAEDSFGVEMFLQMGIAAPIAFLAIFLLMLFFFRRPNLVAAPMIVAMMTVLWTMGALIGGGFTVHIMSSMIPVFLIPIAVLDSIHLLSEVHARYRAAESMAEALREAMDELFTPMLYTSLTTVVGFASLVLTPIPPVQVFGAFVALGVAVAWLLTMTFIPAFAMLLSPASLEKFGHAHEGLGAPHSHLHALRRFSLRRRGLVTALLAVLLGVSAYGISRIHVNDNPVFWFKPSHPLRIADRTMNEHLAGTYLAYLHLKGPEEGAFLDPAWMHYVADLQSFLESEENVGGVTSIADVVRKVQYELLDHAPSAQVVPDRRDAIAQYLFLYEASGGDPEDLFKLITPTQDEVCLWVQMPEGENRKVQHVVHAAEAWMAENPPPTGLEADWGGLAYINVIWQQKMVAGMGKALAGSFLTVLLMMVILFRSLRLGLISMVPLTITIGMTYGAIGLVGRPYDMPIAVLSSLALGLSIDFSIHFIQRFRELLAERGGDFEAAMTDLFQTPAEALARNVLVIALGFVPMFFSKLVPYVTVGVFFVAIMLISGLATFVILPALLSYLPTRSVASRGGRIVRAGVVVLLGVSLGLAAPSGSRAQTEGTPAADAPSAGMPAPAADEIAQRAHLNFYYAGDDGIAHVRMTITNKKGRSREREFVLLRKDLAEGGEQRYFAYFQAPADIKRTAFMAWKDPAKDDARWIYVPALDLVKPIAASEKKSSFVGSDFSYEDVSGRHWSEDTHRLVREEVLGDRPCYVIESVPKSEDYFVRKVSWIDRERFLPLREEY
ncbi:MAG: outer membrane lipoprotein-sorting protein [Candidatus Eisenbacteria bacterium]|uniref:Outer membrane lipoprotein-sorting protein n=1 Tax=Eiseniibacteriota bacterium TaxID=2212470 RepID=A0A956RN36_UNCEI|nr:outer membrane lipoprotein-sorting protein [Candidatus Eisenbacteria bacterium]